MEKLERTVEQLTVKQL